jgi:hypothetical protein
VNRYYIEKAFAETDCECPEHLCTHPEGFKSYAFWIVVDRQDVDGDGRYGGQDFDRYADARRACDRLNRAEAAPVVTNPACPCWSGYHFMHQPTCGCRTCEGAA